MSWINPTESGLAVQGQNLATNVSGHARELGLTTEEADELEANSLVFNGRLQAKESALQAYRKAVSDADASEAALRKMMSALNKKVQANPAVGDSLKKLVGFPVYFRPGQSSPKTPVNLVATVSGQNEIVLRWRRAGNASSALFFVQQRTSGGAWLTLGTTQNLSFRFHTAFPGVPTEFRIIAQVRNLQSAPSIAVSLWAEGESDFGASLESAA